MHPVMTQAVAAERAREFRAAAAAAGRARQLRRPAGVRLLRRFPRGGPGPAAARSEVSLTPALANSPSPRTGEPSAVPAP
jgi:hypothetical protein